MAALFQPLAGGAVTVGQMEAVAMLRKAKGAFVAAVVFSQAILVMACFSVSFVWWELNDGVNNLDYELFLWKLNICDAEEITCAQPSESMKDWASPYSGGAAWAGISQMAMAFMILAAVFSVLIATGSLAFARRVNHLMGTVSWQPDVGTQLMSFFIRAPAAVSRLASAQSLLLALSWGPYLGVVFRFAGANFSGLSSGPGVGFILACICSGLAVLLVGTTRRAARQVLLAEAALLAGGAAPVPIGGAFVPVAQQTYGYIPAGPPPQQVVGFAQPVYMQPPPPPPQQYAQQQVYYPPPQQAPVQAPAVPIGGDYY